MDVERIQKVNNLALDLMKQGLAQDREEAVVKAEEIFKERDTEDYANIRETMKQDQPEVKEEQKTSQSELSEDKIKDILGKNTTFIIKTFKEFQDKLDSMQKEIDFLRNTSGRSPAVKEIVTNEVKEVPPPVQEPKSEVAQEQKSQEQKPASQENHPRSGDYKENDVSIEKFFYMGNK
jgi:hypothetical protein